MTPTVRERDAGHHEDPIGGESRLESVSIAGFVERLGRLSGDRMAQVCVALKIAVDCSR